MIDRAAWNMSSNPDVKGRNEGRRVAEETRRRERKREKEREREVVPAMADCRGSFNVATPVITSALTGDDSPSLFRGFIGSSSTREGPREADTRRGRENLLDDIAERSVSCLHVTSRLFTARTKLIAIT
ncbi:hypothetical protein PUN28_014929 [Cardiocondyla obscurior]|uniref:Uncharacterized protein n=1 Tax=Cardiocondyla obscurior TaxID=286306 RepID=A0AAW2EZ97_9HYME